MGNTDTKPQFYSYDSKTSCLTCDKLRSEKIIMEKTFVQLKNERDNYAKKIQEWERAFTQLKDENKSLLTQRKETLDKANELGHNLNQLLSENKRQEEEILRKDLLEKQLRTRLSQWTQEHQVKQKNLSEDRNKRDKNDIPEKLPIRRVTTKEMSNKPGDSVLLGKGGFGTVFRTVLNIAYKKNEFPNDADIESDVESFQNEALNLSKLDHPNIIKCYGIVEERTEKCYEIGILLELMDINLESFIKKNLKRLSTVKKAWIMLEIAKGIQYLHSKKLIHCDLKPNNVLLNYTKTETGVEIECIKLCDFGLTYLLKHDGTTRSTLTGVTPHYMPPEYCRTDNDQRSIRSKAVDIWSFAMILYFIFKEHSPWAHLSNQEVENLFRKDNFRFFEQNEKTEFPQINQLIEDCSSYDHTKRPSIDTVIVRLTQVDYFK